MNKRIAIKADLLADAHCRKKVDPLARIESYTDFAALAAELDRVAPQSVSVQGGSSPYPTQAMVRILVFKRLYKLSDEQIEYQLFDRMSYKRFCGLASRDEKALIRQGAMPAGWKPSKRRQKDLDATWTSKHGKSHFGYRLSVNVNKKYKFIRKIETEAASTRDSQHFGSVFDVINTSRDVYADRGYPCGVREAGLKKSGFRNQIQRKGQRHKPLPGHQQQRNRRIARMRACVCGHQADGRQADPHDRTDASELCNDDDGSLLQPEVAGVYFRKAGIKAF